jgi:hypothetical protein
MSQHVVTQDSSANTLQTVTITAPNRQKNSAPTKKILIHSITVTTKGADIVDDTGILLTTATSETWNAELRGGKVFGGHFDFSHPIDCGNGNVTIAVDAAGARFSSI